VISHHYNIHPWHQKGGLFLPLLVLQIHFLHCTLFFLIFYPIYPSSFMSYMFLHVFGNLSATSCNIVKSNLSSHSSHSSHCTYPIKSTIYPCTISFPQYGQYLNACTSLS